MQPAVMLPVNRLGGAFSHVVILHEPNISVGWHAYAHLQPGLMAVPSYAAGCPFWPAAAAAHGSPAAWQRVHVVMHPGAGAPAESAAAAAAAATTAHTTTAGGAAGTGGSCSRYVSVCVCGGGGGGVGGGLGVGRGGEWVTAGATATHGNTSTDTGSCLWHVVVLHGQRPIHSS
jgi:hypothetical protein